MQEDNTSRRQRYVHLARRPLLSSPSPYPDVDPSLFNQSIANFHTLINEASNVVDTLSTSNELNAELMNAAQQSDTSRIHHLLDQIGIQSDYDVSYTPESFRLELKNSVQDMECCQLLMVFRWR
ncbi:hypothetical protein [Caldalkalibacillus salinus]|uniref:hypothetical protein n=1 Tax=Caldalkalibacillus salinus TaxID=2803787 RepID=UPI0019230147|nr:hypothetical protein [Caldalkalibacillus salinus]